jgi:hypothetical protein
LNNWNAVPKNFANDRYEVGNRIQQRNGGRELAIDQSSLGRPANEVLYWRAPKEALGDFVTLYDGNIDIHFNNDGNDDEEPSNDEFIWLRGNNIDLVHKLPSTQRFKANTNVTYSVPCNEVGEYYLAIDYLKINDIRLSREHSLVKTVPISIEKIFSWLSQIWIHY